MQASYNIPAFNIILNFLVSKVWRASLAYIFFRYMVKVYKSIANFKKSVGIPPPTNLCPYVSDQ